MSYIVCLFAIALSFGLNSVTDDEHSVSSVGGSDAASWNKYRLHGISVTFKVVADSLKGKGLSEFVSSNVVTLVE